MIRAHSSHGGSQPPPTDRTERPMPTSPTSRPAAAHDEPAPSRDAWRPRALRRPFRALLACCLLLVAAAGWGVETDPDEEVEEAPAGPSWAKPVAGWVPVQPGEHPRLFFRKSDLPALRARMETPEGRAILARLRATLGGGEAMPTIYNPATRAYSRGSYSAQILKQEGAYTISHAAGFGFLYQLTGDAKYADLARQCVEKAIAGQRDRDDRYSLVAPGGQLRAGPSLGWYALAYDLCYDGWPADFRATVLTTLMTVNDAAHGKALQQADPTSKRMSAMDLGVLALRPKHMPASNHYGSIVGGAILTLLAIKGDPGADAALVDEGLAKSEQRIVGLFTTGFGDAGYYAEGPGPSHVAANTALAPALQALRVAAGRDYTQQPGVRWMTMRWAYDLIAGKDGRPKYPCRQIGHNASYGTDDFLGPEQGGGMSHGGWFSQGFGIIPDEMKPALLWTWTNVVRDAMKDNYDTANYPHRAILAFINWPIGVQPRNPAEVLPRIRHDTIHGYLSTRNRWQDSDDVIVSVWTQSGPRGWIGRKPVPSDHTQIMAYGGGHLTMLGGSGGGAPSIVWQQPDGSAAFAAGGGKVAVDFSRRAGVDALVVGPQRDVKRRYPVTAFMISDADTRIGRKRRVGITSFSPTGIHPAPRSEGERIVVGGQTIALDANGVPVFAPLDGVEPGMGERTLDAKAINAQRSPYEVIPPEEIVLPADPILHLACDAIVTGDGAPTVADAGPNRLRAEIVGEAGLDEGILGKAIVLSGADNYLMVAPDPAIDLAGRGVTISMWFRNQGSAAGEEAVLLEKNRWGGRKTPDCYSYCIDANNGIGFNTPNASGFPRAAVGSWTDGRWHHTVSVFDAAGKSITIYFDGVVIAAKKNLGGSGLIGDGSAPLTIGARGVGDKASNFFGGLIDEVRVHDRPLTRGEVRALWLQGKEKVDPTP